MKPDARRKGDIEFRCESFPNLQSVSSFYSVIGSMQLFNKYANGLSQATLLARDRGILG